MTARSRSSLFLGLALLVALAIAFWRPGDSGGFWAGVEGRFLDLRFALRGPLTPPDSVAILAVDDTDLERLGRFPPPRDAIAEAVAAASAAGATAVALDLLLVDRTDDDPVLRDALAANGRSVLAVARGGSETTAPELAPALGRSAVGVAIGAPGDSGAMPLGPHPVLAETSLLGHANIELDPDGALRRFPAAVAFAGSGGPVWLPGLAIAAAGLASESGPLRMTFPDRGRSGMIEIAGDTVPLDHRAAVPVVWYGAEGTLPTWHLRDLEKADLEGKLVFIGITALGVGDRHPTPFDATLPGVEAQATLAANLLGGVHLRRDASVWAWDYALAALAAVVAFLAAALERPAVAIAAVIVTATAVGAVLQAAFMAGLWLDATTSVLALGAGAASGAMSRLLQHRRRSANLARYQSPHMAEVLANEDRPGFDGRAQPAVVLFVDIVGFTGLSERDGPERTAAFLRRFHATVERAAIYHGGVVEQYAGDGAMVIFGLPLPAPQDPESAFGCIEALWDTTPREVPVRISAHFGTVRASVLGGDQHRHVTVTGDVVNAASRLQEIAKAADASVAVSDALLVQSGEATAWTRRLGLVDLGERTLRGREETLHVWAGTPPGEDDA